MDGDSSIHMVIICNRFWPIPIWWYIATSSTRTRRGGSCLRDIYIYKTFLIYRTCMRRAPAKPVRACTLRKLCPVSHVTFEAPLRTSHFTLLTALFTLHTAQANRPHTGGTFHRRLQPLYTEKHKVSCSGFLPTTQSMQHSCSHSNAICNHSFKKRIELRTQEQPLVAEHRGGTKGPQPQPPHTRGTFHRRLQPLYTEKHKVSCSGFLPTTQSMQHSCSHSNAICNHSFKKRIELRTQEQPLVAEHRGGTKGPQPQPPHTGGTFHRRLQPLYTEKHKVSCSGFLPTTQSMQHSCSHSNAICNRSFKKRIELRTQEQPLVAEHRGGTKGPQPQPPHTGGTFHPRLQPLYTEKHKVSCSGFLPKQSPCNIHAICNHRFQTPYKYAHTQAQPKQLEATVTMQQKRRQTDRSRNRRTQEVPFIAGCSHFTRKNTRFPAPASSPQHRACNIHAAKGPQPQPPHTRGTFHRRLQPLYTEKCKVSCSGFLPKTKPMQHSCDLQPQIPNTL